MSEFDCKDAGCCCSCHTAIAPSVHPAEPLPVSDEVDTIDECECPPEESGPVMCLGCGGTVARELLQDLRAHLAAERERREAAERSAESFERCNAEEFGYIRDAFKEAGLHHFGPLDGCRVAHQIGDLAKDRDDLRAQLAARDATIAELTKRAEEAEQNLYATRRIADDRKSAHQACISACGARDATIARLRKALTECKRLTFDMQEFYQHRPDGLRALEDLHRAVGNVVSTTLAETDLEKKP